MTTRGTKAKRKKPEPTLHEQQPATIAALEAGARAANPNISVPDIQQFSITEIAAILGIARRGACELVENCKIYAVRYGQRMHLISREALLEYLQFPTGQSGKVGQEYSAKRRAKVLARYKAAGIDPPAGQYAEVVTVLPPGQRKDGKPARRKRKAG